MKKKMALICILLFLITFFACITTLWRNNDNLSLGSSFKVGTVKIKMFDKLGMEDFPMDGVLNVHPGDHFDKQVWVVSLGSKKTYVRALIEIKWLSPGGMLLPIKNNSFDTVILNFGPDWIAGPKEENPSKGGQWYYYRHIMKQDQVSTKLLDGVTFCGASINNSYQGATFTIAIHAEGVQASYEAFLYEWKVHGSFGLKYKVPVAGVEEWIP